MPNLLKRVESLEASEIESRQVYIILTTIAHSADADIVAIHGKRKSWYKRDGEDFDQIIKRVEDDSMGLTVVRAEYDNE